MPYVFNQIKQAIKKDDKFKPTATSTVGGAGGATTEVGNKVANAPTKESPDTPRMKDYLDKNTMQYNTSPVNEVYQQAGKRAGEQKEEIKGKEQEKFTSGVSNVVKPTWQKPAAPERKYAESWETNPNPTFDESGQLMKERPTDVDENAYAEQKAGLQEYINKIRGGYAAGTDTIADPQTEQAKDLLTSRLGRRGLLTREYEGDTSHYTEGMQTLDSALAERSGIDTRGAGEQYKAVASDVERGREDLTGYRESLGQQRDALVGQSEQDITQVDADLQADREQYTNLDRQYEREVVEAAERKQQNDIRFREEQIAEAEAKKKQEQLDKERAQQQLETDRQKEYNDYIIKEQSNMIAAANQAYEDAVQEKRDVAREAAEARIMQQFVGLLARKGEYIQGSKMGMNYTTVYDDPAAYNGDNYKEVLEEIRDTYGISIKKSELPAIAKKYKDKYGSYSAIGENRKEVTSYLKQQQGAWSAMPNPNISQFMPSKSTYDSYETWKARNQY